MDEIKNKTGIFYGWYIVFGLATVGMVSVGMGGMTMGLFIEPMNDELGISHAYFGLSQTARLIGFSISSWFIGRVLDKYGARVPMAIAALAMGIILIAMAYIQTGWHMVALIFFAGLIGLQGVGGNLYQTVPLSRWFIKKRGKAMSIAFLGTTAGIFIFAPILQYTITYIGWRFAWKAIGGGACLVVFFISILIIRKEPASMGLLPDGDTVEEIPESETESPRPSPLYGEISWTRPQALRSFTFWGLTVVLGLRMFALGTANIFRIPYFIESGFSPQLVAWAVSIEAIIAAIIAIPTGWAMDRFQARFVASASIVFLIITFIVTIYVNSNFMVFIACALYGIAASSFMVSNSAIWPIYFGGKNIGEIRGLVAPFSTFFGAVGAPLTGLVKDKTGSFIPIWIVAIVLLAVSSFIMLLTRKPVPPVNDNRNRP